MELLNIMKFMDIGTYLYVRCFCTLAGEDEFGNKYYISNKKNSENRYTRYVIYSGKKEATKIPPMWHAWVHYMSDEVPDSSKQYKWQKEKSPNKTGTKEAYSPVGHKLQKYESWQP